MFFSLTNAALLAGGSFLALIFVMMLLASGKFDAMTEPLDAKQYALKEIYGVGFMLMGLFRYKLTGKGERKRRQLLTLLHGERYAEYYLRINAAQRFSFCFLMLVAGFAIFGLAGDMTILFVFVGFAALSVYYFATLPQSTMDKKTEMVLNDFADVVSKLALLVNAGMILREAWERVAFTGESELYKEMRLCITDMNNGVSEVDAYTSFAMRSMSPEIKKFISTVIQGVVKGSGELVEMIKQQSRELWDNKRNRVRQQGQKAASKLLIPICIMFVGVLIIVVVPIFANMSF